MPEASIGVFPDVGASHFLSCLPGYFGEYLGLTGARLDGTEMLACGLATHFVLSKDLVSLENELTLMASSDVWSRAIISKVTSKFVNRVNIKEGSAYNRLEVINNCFSKETVEEMLSSLESFATLVAEKWINDAIRSMKSASPLSLKLFLRTIREGRSQKLGQCLIREYIVMSHVLRRTISGEFYEGSRAMLFDKDKNPQWVPSKLELVSGKMVDACFSRVVDEDWEPLQLAARSNLTCGEISRL